MFVLFTLSLSPAALEVFENHSVQFTPTSDVYGVVEFSYVMRPVGGWRGHFEVLRCKRVERLEYCIVVLRVA